jgi:hypothetical protein
VKKSYPKILRNRKRRIRLDPRRGWSDQGEPIVKASNIHYEMAEKARAVNCGGIGAIHLMINKLGLFVEFCFRGCLISLQAMHPLCGSLTLHVAGVNRQREWSLNRDVIALTSVGLLVAFVQAA